MALNTPVSVQGVPLAVSDVELFVLKRDGVYAELALPNRVAHTSDDGSLYLTTMRLVYVPTKRTLAFSSYEVPLALLSHESFNQPIFGANNLTGTSAPLHGGGIHGTSNFTFYFYKGGVGTFLPLFFRLVEDTRRRARQQAQQQPAGGGAAGAGAGASAAAAAGGAPGGPTFAPMPSAAAVQKLTQHAYVDPNDPSHVYVNQPVVAARAPPSQPPPQPAAPTKPLGAGATLADAKAAAASSTAAAAKSAAVAGANALAAGAGGGGAPSAPGGPWPSSPPPPYESAPPAQAPLSASAKPSAK